MFGVQGLSRLRCIISTTILQKTWQEWQQSLSRLRCIISTTILQKTWQEWQQGLSRLRCIISTTILQKTWQEWQQNCFLQSCFSVLTLIQRPFHPRVIAVARKRHSHSAKSAGGRLHLYMLKPLTQQSQSGLAMPLCRHSGGTYPKISSHTTGQRTVGVSCLSSLSHWGLILA